MGSPYDPIAPGYDDMLRHDTWIREELWRRFDAAFTAGDRVLDVGCGTGNDALHLASRGVQVVGIDGSERMIAEASKKADEAGADAVRFEHLTVQDLASLDDAPFDGLVSAFAALNMLEDLTGFAVDAHRLVRPGGTLILHMLSRYSVWRLASLVRHRRFDELRDALGGVEIAHIGSARVRHRTYTPEEAYRRYFAGRFRLIDSYGVALLRPARRGRRVPAALLETLGGLERRTRGLWPARNLGRFMVLELERL